MQLQGYIHVNEACQQHNELLDEIFPAYIMSHDSMAWTDIVIGDGN